MLLKRLIKYKNLFFILLFCSLYVGLSSIYPTLPGLYMDEVIRKNPGIHIAYKNIEPPYPYHFFLKHSNGTEFPLMLKHYIGALYAYRTALITSIFGCSPIIERLENVFFTFLALIFTFLIVKKLTTDSVAILTCLFLSIDNSFVFFSKIAFLSYYFFKVFLIYLLFLYEKYNNPILLYLSGLWAGIGVWARADFIIIPTSIGCAFWFMGREIPNSEKIRKVYIFMKGFVLGVFPFLLYNLFTSFNTFRPMFKALLAIDAYNLTPMDERRLPPFTENLFVKFEKLAHILNGGAFNHLVANENPIGIPWLWCGYLIGTILALYKGATTKEEEKLKKAITISAIFGGTILFQIIIIPQANQYHHLIQIFPIPQLFMAITIYFFFLHNTSRVNWRRLLAIILCTGMICSQILLDINTILLLKRTGGRGNWSDAIYSLFDYVQKNKEKKFIIMDWGISSQLYYMSCGKAKIKELFWSDNLQVPVLNSYLRNKNNLFVFHADKFQWRKNLKKLFFEYAGKNVNLVKQVFNREGEKIFEIYENYPNEKIVDLSTLKHYISFSEKGHENQLYGDWYSIEKIKETFFRWTGKKFGFYLDNSKKYNKMEIRGYSRVDKIEEEAVEMKLFINDKFVFRHRFEKNGEFLLSIPLSPDIKKEKILKVEGELDKTFRAPPDIRDLGLLITHIELKR